MPQIVPLLVPKVRPLGRLPLISQEVIMPGPVRLAINGKSLLAMLTVSIKFSGEYDSVGSWSMTVMLR